MPPKVDELSYLPTDDYGSFDLAPPRVQSGAQPQRILLALLGDYWRGGDKSIPSATLVRLVTEFGISETSARVALSRLGRRGFLAMSKSGRNTSYSLTPRAERFLEDAIRTILGFGAPRLDWDGRWWCVAFSVPEGDRQLRHALRTKLRWAGFAPLYDGFWICPRDRSPHVLKALRDLDVTSATVFAAAVLPESPRGGAPPLAWDIKEIKKEYELFIRRHAPTVRRHRAGTLSPTQALVERFAAIDDWLAMSIEDPELPDALLPRRWPRDEARAILLELYDGLGALAASRVREVLVDTAPELAKYVRVLSSSQVLSKRPNR